MRTRRGRRLTRGLGPRRARGGVFAAAALTAAAALAGTGAGAATATAAPGDGVRDSAFAPVPDASAAAPAPGGPDLPVWRSRRAAGPERDEELRAVAARDSLDAWSVGYREDPSGVNVPVAERFDGARWNATGPLAHRPSVGAAANGKLDAVLPLSARDVWAVGSWNDAAAFQDRSLAEHFDGRRWQEVPLPAEAADRSAYPSALAGTGPDDLWTVGVTAQDRIGAPRPLAYHWNGRAWSSVATPEPGGDALLSGAAADGDGRVWAVGVVYDARGEGRPLVERWDGAAWRIVPTPHTAGRGESLESVAVLGPDDVWAVGGSSTPDGTNSPLTLHWDGRTWTEVAAPAVHADLHGVTAYGEHGLIAVGEQQGVATPAFTMRWDGAAWHAEPAATDAAGQGASLFGVAAVPHPLPGTPTAWAVGSTLPQFQPTWRPIVQGYGGVPVR
ncbi:hypothetical protein ACFZAM_35560 [Streptomyces sp. NPDC008079]|uniref:hypothetical protein n=1 Tax=Streptomyces sp. NPDC008079 TaxID=3364806 RepID=UPI0036EBE369